MLRQARTLNFMNMIKDLDISKSTISFKTILINQLDKYLKLKKSSLSLNLFKDYTRTIKEVCKEIGSEFKQF